MKLLAAAAAAAFSIAGLATAAHAGQTLEAIKSNGTLKCGVSTPLAGFALADSAGTFTGMDVEFCRAVAAAILGDPAKVTFTVLNTQNRFPALQSGEVDLLSRVTTWTMSRDTELGFHFAGIWFYDGQGFMVPKKLGVSSAKELNGATVCVLPGTTTELNLADYFRAQKMEFSPVVIEDATELRNAYFEGRCDVYTTDSSGLAATRANFAPNPADHIILPEVISKEPLGPVVRRGDDELFAIVKWTLFALTTAEELGVTQANVDEMLKSENVSIQRLLGVADEMGKKLGLDNEWAYRAIKAVGNYGEIFDRNVGPSTPIGLERGVNALWTNGGLHYAPPIR